VQFFLRHSVLVLKDLSLLERVEEESMVELTNRVHLENGHTKEKEALTGHYTVPIYSLTALSKQTELS